MAFLIMVSWQVSNGETSSIEVLSVIRRYMPVDFTHKMAIFSMGLAPLAHWMHPVPPVPELP